VDSPSIITTWVKVERITPINPRLSEAMMKHPLLKSDEKI
jgi:hypothetical protein